MKIIGVCCSPRKGKTTCYALEKCLEAVREAAPGMETDLFELADYKFGGCLACGQCTKELKCSQEDDFEKILMPSDRSCPGGIDSSHTGLSGFHDLPMQGLSGSLRLLETERVSAAQQGGRGYCRGGSPKRGAESDHSGRSSRPVGSGYGYRQRRPAYGPFRGNGLERPSRRYCWGCFWTGDGSKPGQKGGRISLDDPQVKILFATDPHTTTTDNFIAFDRRTCRRSKPAIASRGKILYAPKALAIRVAVSRRHPVPSLSVARKIFPGHIEQ